MLLGWNRAKKLLPAKTGTLTEGKPRVTKIVTAGAAMSFSSVSVIANALRLRTTSLA